MIAVDEWMVLFQWYGFRRFVKASPPSTTYQLLPSVGEYFVNPHHPLSSTVASTLTNRTCFRCVIRVTTSRKNLMFNLRRAISNGCVVRPSLSVQSTLITHTHTHTHTETSRMLVRLHTLSSINSNQPVRFPMSITLT
ncbi:hypothetical protein G7K_5400-t1 [Saitoella complicata NRRL Y-17804]|uniref:Uncharacterized protein n=1 Tax=Saitoella complicata (strain BCRC 22490 / CBS 7301 / JCM 7358 / NBRC 10748 / NRRL Y-17804) TaxID=698492 RepID=A0A0E9NPD9_SAICN|nr:hypothetical protein G7K_5400-t1 [Saitoella complicata NRRL Y-17804]